MDNQIIISRYNEDISWIHSFRDISLIYNKGINNIDSNIFNVVQLKNVGRESHTYLYHIVNNYYNLANVTLFTQGTKPSYGYNILNNGGGDGGHYYCPLTIYDYITAKNGLFIFTEITSLSNGRHVIRNGYNNYAKRKKNKCIPQSNQPIFETPLPDKCFSLDDYESYTDNINFIVHIAKECNNAKDTTTSPYPCSKLTFWKKYIKLPLPPKNFLWYAQGAIFSVTREQIHRRPLDDYKILLNDFNNSNKQYLGFLMEWFWYPLLTSESITCDDNYYNINSTSAKLQKVLNYLECKDCGEFNEEQYKNMKL